MTISGRGGRTPAFANKATGRRQIAIRPATREDSRMIAKLAYLADGDTLAFILRGIDPTAEAMPVYREMAAATTGILSQENCIIAESGDRIVGMANAFPARLIESEIAGLILTEREELLRPRVELNEPTSYLLNSIAVLPGYRRLGVGAALLAAVIEDGKRQLFPSVTVHVWADNTEAVAFYFHAGFKEVRRASISWHPDLSRTGGSLLMMLPIEVEAEIR